MSGITTHTLGPGETTTPAKIAALTGTPEGHQDYRKVTKAISDAARGPVGYRDTSGSDFGEPHLYNVKVANAICKILELPVRFKRGGK